MTDASAPWRVSLHGGHSGEFCDHAVGTLHEVLDAAVRRGFAVYGVSEHAPRTAPHLLYDEEHRRGWTVETVVGLFDAYCDALPPLVHAFADRLTVLRGFELEVVPGATWLKDMQAIRERGFDFVVGSVHHLHEISLDGPDELFVEILAKSGGLEAASVAYYEAVEDMIRRFEPDVIAHLDLIRKNGHRHGDCATPPAREAALRCLDAAADTGGILDLNVAAFRKGLATPYPEPWLIAAAKERGVPFCFGDDSHGPAQVGANIDRGRTYLLENGVSSITTLDRVDGAIVRREIPLEP